MLKVTEFRLHGRGGQGIVVAAAVFADIEKALEE